MTREEAMNYLERIKQEYDCSYEEDALDMAIKAISSAEPKTVIYSGDGYADGEMVYNMAECPTCGYEYENGDKDWGLLFCPSCGQKLNWERSGE
jgi:hypothetical protein